MGWLARLLGRDKAKSTASEPVSDSSFSRRGWVAAEDTQRATTTRLFLEEVAATLGVKDPVVVPRPQDQRDDLRGSASDFPLTITVDYRGELADITFRYEDTGLLPIDLEYDPEAATATGDRVMLAPQIFVEGDDANSQAARFRELPDIVQRRILTELKRLRIRHFRSRRAEFDIVMFDAARDREAPVQWLVETVGLALEMTGARGAVAPGAHKPRPRPKATT